GRPNAAESVSAIVSVCSETVTARGTRPRRKKSRGQSDFNAVVMAGANGCSMLEQTRRIAPARRDREESVARLATIYSARPQLAWIRQARAASGRFQPTKRAWR